jgi:hypothetical protein
LGHAATGNCGFVAANDPVWNHLVATRKNLEGIMMRAVRFANVALFLASMTLSITAHTALAANIDEVMSSDGLQKISVPGLDLAYALPGATLAGYSKVMLDPIDVSFHKDWDPKVPGSPFKLSTKDRENIKTKVKTLVNAAFVKALQADGGYPVVKEAGPDVLRVRVIIVNLYINAPDIKTAGRVRTYAVGGGEMTIIADLSDSETGAVIARVVDRSKARSSGMMTLTNSVTNAADAQDIASKWAGILRDALDKARGIGGK